MTEAAAESGGAAGPASIVLATAGGSAADVVKASRVALLDAARGLALGAMILFHFTWDLDYFGLAPAGLSQTEAFKVLGHAIAAAFLFIVGASLWLASRRGLRFAAFFRRVAAIGAAALLITLATRLVFPNEYIFFGILHCIAVASLAAALFLRVPAPLTALAGAAALALPSFVALSALNAPAFQWLGLGTYEPVTNDWAPFFPSFGYVLLGLAAARIVDRTGRLKNLAAWSPRAAAGRLLCRGGRRSLLVYLAHQPLMFGALFILAPLTGAPLAKETGSFVQECKTQCVARGAEGGFCARVCGCVADRIEPTPLWKQVLANDLTASERDRFNDVARVCIRDLGAAAPPR